MKRFSLLSAFVFISAPGLAFEPAFSAELLPKGAWQAGVFSPLRVGISDDLELRVHPIAALVSPHAVLRAPHGKFIGGTLTGEYGIGLPTYGMRMLQGEGIGRLFPGDHEIPLMVAPRLGVVWSKGDPKRRIYTLRADLTMGIALSAPARPLQSPGEGWLDLLFAPATDGYRARLGVIYDRSMGERFRMRTSLDAYLTGSADNPMMLLGRQTLDIAAWKSSAGSWRRLSVGVAWLNSVSHAHGGGRSNDFMPLIDLVF